jgi:hypothetical protein
MCTLWSCNHGGAAMASKRHNPPVIQFQTATIKVNEHNQRQSISLQPNSSRFILIHCFNPISNVLNNCLLRGFPTKNMNHVLPPLGLAWQREYYIRTVSHHVSHFVIFSIPYLIQFSYIQTFSLAV